MKFLYRLVLFVFVLSLYSCITEVDKDYSNIEVKPVFNSIVKDGNPVKIHLSQTDEMGGEPIDVFTNAKVNLFRNDTLIEILMCNADDYYVSDEIVCSGNTYSCEVLIPGFDTLWCETQIPIANRIIDIEEIFDMGIDEEGGQYSGLKISFKNDILEKAYYEMIVRNANDGDYWAYYVMRVVDPVLLNEGLSLLLFSNDIITDSVYTMTVVLQKFTSSLYIDGVKHEKLFDRMVELRTVSYDYYHYHKQLYLYNEGRYNTAFGQLVTSFPMHSNIQNGYGIFASYSSFFTDTIKSEKYVPVD